MNKSVRRVVIATITVVVVIGASLLVYEKAIAPQLSPDGSAFTDPAVTPNDLIANKADFLNKKVRVTGRLDYFETCPPGVNGECVLTGFIIESNGQPLLPADTEKSIHLFEGKSYVGCASLDVPEGCGGWIEGQEYEVVGTFKYLTANGKETSTLILEVDTKRAL